MFAYGACLFAVRLLSSRDIGEHDVQNRISFDIFFLLRPKHGCENAVALKLAPFWTSQLRVWFQQTEAQFALSFWGSNLFFFPSS